jgi:hypothetical protein
MNGTYNVIFPSFRGYLIRVSPIGEKSFYFIQFANWDPTRRGYTDLREQISWLDAEGYTRVYD